MKVDPEDLKCLAEDLETIQNDYRNVLEVEPRMKAPLEEVSRMARKRYDDVKDKPE